MHSPRPFGLGQEGDAPTVDDLAAVSHLAQRLTHLKQTWGVDSLRMVRALPDGGYVVMQDMGGIFKAVTVKTGTTLEDLQAAETLFVPMLYSGVITRALVEYGDETDGVEMRLTKQARMRLGGYKQGNLAAEKQHLLRFRIEYHDGVQEFKPKNQGFWLHTQYVQQRPTWYSGAMAEVMQIVGGYGRQDVLNLPDKPMERAQYRLPTIVAELIRKEMQSGVLPGYNGKPPVDGKFRYDYKFASSHGVAFGEDGKPWLVQIDYSGCWLMPLPLVPATTTQAFRRHIIEVDDREILAILDRFGGMPSGEGFPTGKTREAWRKAGVIIKGCDMKPFYQHSGYSSACGWAFNASGTEAFNTCHDYDDDQGLGYGLAFGLSLNIAALPSPQTPAHPLEAMNYLAAVLELLPSGAEGQVLRFKLSRATPEQINARMGMRIDEREVDHWRNLEMPPIVKATVRLSEVGRGFLYHPAKFHYQPQIKFPEPFEGGCVSHNFSPLINGRYRQSYPNSDTIMWGSYVGDTLKVIKYFADWGDFAREKESDFEPCMIVGSWSETTTTGNSSAQGHFYTTDIDLREVMAPVETKTVITGKDLGWGKKPCHAFDAFFAMQGTLWRNRWYSHDTTTTTTEGKRLNIGVCIAYFCRGIHLLGHEKTYTSKSKHRSKSLHAVQDPTSYRFWTYHFVHAWVGGAAPPGAGRPYPKNGNPVWVEEERYQPSLCSDFADQGSWLPPPADVTQWVHPDSNQWAHEWSADAPKFQTSSQTINSERGVERAGMSVVAAFDRSIEVHQSQPEFLFFYGSPTEFGDVFYRDATAVVFGKAIYANAMYALNTRKHFGFCRLADHKTAHQFIGVINE